MQCPRCESERIQRDYDDAIVLLRMVGLHKLLCNNCGLVFKGFDPLGNRERTTPTSKEKHRPNRRRGPRFNAHLPAAISLIDTVQVGKVAYSQPSRGHCEAISKFGMSLSLVGARFSDGELARIGRLLFVRVDLPDGAIEAVVTIVTTGRMREEKKQKWVLGVTIHQMSDADSERLAGYLEKQAQKEPLIISD